MYVQSFASSRVSASWFWFAAATAFCNASGSQGTDTVAERAEPTNPPPPTTRIATATQAVANLLIPLRLDSDRFAVFCQATRRGQSSKKMPGFQDIQKRGQPRAIA